MTQTVKLPNGDTLQFPDGMGDDEITKVISDNYPQFAPKAAAANVPAEPPANPSGTTAMAADPSADPPANADVPLDDATAADPNGAAPQQNQFSASRMSRADYEKQFRAINPGAAQGAVDAALAQYDQQKAAQLKAADTKRQAGPMKPVPTPEQFFDQRLNARLEGKQNGVVPQLPARQAPESLDLGTKHTDQPYTGDESQLGAAASYLGRSSAAGLYDLAGAGAKLLDAVNPFTTSDADAAILFKDDPAKLKQMQDESVALGLGRFARAMQADSSAQMDKVSPRAQHDYGLLQYATLDANKTAFSSPVKIIGDAIRSLPSSLAMGVSAYLTRGASMRAEEAALAAGFSADAAKFAGIEAAGKMMGSVAAGSEGAIGYAQQALQTEEETGKLPMDQLKKSPKFQQLLTQGYTPETARAKIIADTAEHAGQIAGLVDAVTNKYGGEVLGRIIGEGGPFMRRMLSGMADEGATEFVQSAGEQMGGNFATQQNADPNQNIWDGVGESAVAGLAVGGLMGGTTAGVAGHHGHAHFDDGSVGAEAARQAALGQWNNNGLSPRPYVATDGRVEPSWSDVAGPGAGAAPAVRAAPTIGDITSATSVDEAIAAANAVVNSMTPHATAADIDALEEQAGLMSAAEQTRTASPKTEQSSAGTIPLGLGNSVNTALPHGESSATILNPATTGIADTATDWHPFPPEMRTLGVPRAQMPQIRAEHRGAMVNFINARGISHEQVEVPAESLRPTQREFSISKVDKALEHEGGNRSILISSDNYVLDGHHQWMAAALSGEPVPAIRLNAPIKELVKTIHQFPSATVDTSSASTAPAEASRPLTPYEQGQERIRKQEEVVRQAIENQATHRAGQAPQEPGSSLPTAAERAPAAAPLPPPKPTAGQRARERVKQENPFLGFLGEHGVHIDERSDTGGQKSRAGTVMIPGYGQLYRKKGLRLDELAQLAHEAGFLSDQDMANPTDNAGTRKLADMIQRAAHSKEVIAQSGLLDAAAPTSDQRLLDEAQRLGIESDGKTTDQLYDAVTAAHAGEEAQRATSGAATHDEQDVVNHYESQITPQELADADIPFDLNDPRLSSANNLTDEQIDALFGLQKAEGPRADRGETQGHADQRADEGAAPAGEQDAAGQDLLSSYTPGEVVARDDAAAAREKATQAERDKLEAQRKKAQDAKERRARADATVDDFQLGQDAHDQLSGQRGMFDEPATAPSQPTALQQEVERAKLENHKYDPERARPLLLIPCAETKLEGTHKAVDLYKGALFDVYRKWKPTENRPDVYILSAKHGIVHGDTLLENYEQPMTKERLAELLAKPVDLSLFKGKNFNEVYIAGSAQYRQLGQQYVDELRKAGYVGPEAPVDHPPQGAGIGDQRGHFAEYLRKVDLRGPENARELSNQLDAEHAKRVEPAAPDVEITDDLLSVAKNDTAKLDGRLLNDLENDQQGVIVGRPTSINQSLAKGRYTLDDIQGSYGRTLAYLRRTYGSEVTLYRAEAPRDKWSAETQVVYMGDRQLAEKFTRGDKRTVEAYRVPINDIMGLNVQKNGYYEFIVKRQGEPMAKAATEAAASAVGEVGNTDKFAQPTDTGADIPPEFYKGVTAQYRALGDGTLTDMPAHEALAKTREDIQQLEDMLKCMGA